MAEAPKRGVSRRTLLLGATATAGAAVTTAVVVSRDGEPGPAAPRALKLVPARQANALAASIGVNTHFNFNLSVYNQTDRVLEAIADLGVRHVRDRVVDTDPVVRALSQLAESGVRVQGVCGAFLDPESMTSVMSGVVRRYPDPGAVFTAFEGINEPNNDGVPWIAETRTKTRDLHVARGAAGLDEVPIASPALAKLNSDGVEGVTQQQQAANLGRLTDYVDLGNIHVYPRSQLPSADIDSITTYQRDITGDLPIVCSEGGYFTAMNYTGGAFPTPEDVCAVYMPRMIMEHWRRGNRRFYIYELLDDPDPTQAHRESSFGLLGVSGPGAGDAWTPKAHYRAVKNFISILRDAGPPHDVQGITMDVAGDADLTYELVAKRDGRRYLLLWRDVEAYDPKSRSRVGVSGETVRLRFDRRRAVRLYDPTRSAAPLRTVDRSREISLSLADELIIAEIS